MKLILTHAEANAMTGMCQLLLNSFEAGEKDRLSKHINAGGDMVSYLMRYPQPDTFVTEDSVVTTVDEAFTVKICGVLDRHLGRIEKIVNIAKTAWSLAKATLGHLQHDLIDAVTEHAEEHDFDPLLINDVNAAIELADDRHVVFQKSSIHPIFEVRQEELDNVKTNQAYEDFTITEGGHSDIMPAPAGFVQVRFARSYR